MRDSQQYVLLSQTKFLIKNSGMATHSVLTEHLKKHFGFDGFKGNQEAIIQNVLEGKDTFVLMPTGGC